MDESVTLAHAKGILEFGYPRLLDGSTSWESAPFNYLVAALLGLGVEQHMAARFWSALFGSCSIVLIFFVGFRMTSSLLVSLLSAALLGFSNFAIDWSRQAKAYSLLQCLLLGTILLLPLTKIDWSLKRITSLFVLCLLGVLSHRAGYLLPVILVIHVVTYRTQLGINFRNRSIILVLLSGSTLLAVLYFWPSTSSMRSTIAGVIDSHWYDYGALYFGVLFMNLDILFALSLLSAATLLITRNNLTPVIVGCLVYFLAISYRTPLFAYRYLLPIFPVLCLLAAVPVGWARTLIGHKRPITGLIGLLLVALTLIGINASHMRLVSSRFVFVDMTTPRPDWRTVFATIQDRSNASGYHSSTRPLIVTAFPLMVDVYCNTNEFSKGYLPISTTGYPGDEQWRPPYTTATVISSVSELTNTLGYMVLDQFSINMLLNSEAKSYVRTNTPDLIIEGEFPIYAWILHE